MVKKIVVFDLDQTIVDSSVAENFRDTRDWKTAISLIPKMSIYDGIIEVLQEIKRSNMSYAIVTSSPSHYSSAILRHFGLNPEHLVAYHDTKSHKPSPEPFLYLLTKYDLAECKNVISIGDNAKDIVASRAAGISTIGILWGNENNSELIKSNPDIIVASPIELLKYII